ncbi:MAG: ABC transporter ATP-binding protein [Oscillospiraceae bacterium]|nr:ABC transporter ATP-binding protein [Oscillospiraceae bacterium]
MSVLTVLQSLLQVVVALLSRFVIDAALGSRENLAFWGIVLVADMLALVGIHGMLVWCSGSALDKMTAKLRQEMLKTAAFSRDQKLLEYHSGILLNRGMEDVQTVCDGAVNVLPSLIGQVTRLAAAFAAVVLISPAVAGVLLAAAAVVGTLTACMRPAIRKRHRAVRETDEKVMSTMQEDLQQLELIQSLDAQKQILERFGHKITKSLKARFRRRVWTVSSTAVINAVSQVGSGVLLLWGATRVAADTLSYGSLTAMLQLFSLFRSPVLGLSGLWTRLTSIEVAAERLQELLTPVDTGNAMPSARTVTGVVFENVTFSYPGDELPVLQGFDLRLPMENWTCLTGISGRGKSTIFKLMLGLYKPQTGRIYLQTEQGEIPCTEATRHLFAYVPQDYALFSGTILENLQLVAPDLDETRMRQVLSAAQADFVWDLSDREHTQVRENNAGLSKGQLQRLAIARAMLMDRSVFLLDECTSALDSQTECAVLRALHATGKQAILVTHRPEAVTDIDNVTMVSLQT